MPKSPPFTAIKSCRGGNIGIRIKLKGGGSYSQADIQIQTTTDLTTAEAREFAAGLINRADEEDARTAKKQAAEDRRKAWREREIAAGRMKVLSLRDVFRGNV